MVLDWLSGGSGQSIPDLLAKKRYAQAIELLKKEIQKNPDDERIKIQLADTLVLDGKKDAAAKILKSLADDLAERGYAAKSIALLKKIQRIEPTNIDVEQTLARRIRESRLSPQLRSHERVMVNTEAYEPNVRGGIPQKGERMKAVPQVKEFNVSASEDPFSQAGYGSDAAGPGGDESSPEKYTEYSPEHFSPQAEEPKPVVSAEAVSEESPAVQEEVGKSIPSPLFADFSDDELVAFMRGLELLSYQPGDIVVTEGEPGDSLFVVANGAVRAFVKNPHGTNVAIREMGEGDFFGEIALLTGKPRSATITATVRCDLLKLDKRSLASIVRTHPKVRQVLLDFYNARAHDATVSTIRTIDIEEKPAAPSEEASAPAAEPVAVTTPAPAEEAHEISALQLHDAALAYTRSENYLAALPMWREYSELRPDDMQALSVIGVVCAKLERWGEAAEAFRKAASLGAADASIYYNLGVAYGKLSRWTEAAGAFEEAVRLKPDYEKAKASLGKARKQV